MSLAAAVVFSTPDQLHYGIAVLIVRDLNSVAAFSTLNQGSSGNHQPCFRVPWLLLLRQQGCHGAECDPLRIPVAC